MYKISDFAKMTGISQSKVRFYEKNGLLKVRKDTNEYRYFTRWDAFRVNAFRVLLQYGFTVEQAVRMLDERQSDEMFINSLAEKREELKLQIELMNCRKEVLDKVINYLKEDYDSRFEVTEKDDYIYVLASNGIDFSISSKNEELLAQFADLLSITSYARIILKDELINKNSIINPSYTFAIPKSRENYLGKYEKSKTKLLKLGKCIKYYRKETREESQKIESFNELFNYLEKNKYEINGDILLLPSFLNLDGNGSDIEELYIPIK
jgi:DNA-binding transcriptional MerR regulator